MADFNEAKFHELIVYFARRLGPEAALGRVKLAKLLMHSDFMAFRRLGQPITGATYEKWEHGHFPRELVIAEKDLEGAAILTESVDYFGKRLKRISALREPDMSEFSEDEIGVIEGAILMYSHESAKYLSELAHREPGWELSDWREEIPYETGLIGTDRPADSVFEQFLQLHRVA